MDGLVMWKGVFVDGLDKGVGAHATFLVQGSQKFLSALAPIAKHKAELHSVIQLCTNSKRT